MTREELVKLFEQRVTDETIFVGLSAMFPLKCGSTGLITMADPKVVSPKPKIEESTISMSDNLRLTASSRGNPIIASG